MPKEGRKKKTDMLQGMLDLLILRRAKFYKLTAARKKQLDAEWEAWKRFSGAVELILRDA